MKKFAMLAVMLTALVFTGLMAGCGGGGGGGGSASSVAAAAAGSAK